MDLFSLKTFGGLAVFGIIASFWSKICFIFSKILSIFVVKVKIDNQLEARLIFYCKKHFRQIRFNTYNFDTVNCKSKKYNRYIHIPFEKHKNDSLVYLNGWKPLFLNSFTLISKFGGDRDNKSIIYFRGTFDIKKLITDCSAFYEEEISRQNNLKDGQFTNPRFSIYEKIGHDNNHIEGVAEEACLEEEGDFIKELKMGVYSLIGHEPQDLGYDMKYKNNYIDYLYYPKKIFSEIISDLEYWINNEEWYRDKGVPWKRGTLLFGQAGTGKTSLVRAIGEKYDLPIISFHIHSLTNTEFIKEWKTSLSQHSPCIFLIEDIDNIFHGRKKAQTDMLNNKVTFDCLLNLLDGANKEDGYYLFITTNKIEQLDSALGIPRNGDNEYTISTRPGRIDRVIELPLLDETGRKEISERIMDDIVPKDLISEAIDKGYKDTPAQFLERCRGIAVHHHIKNELILNNKGG